MAESITIRTASSTEIVKIAVPGPQGATGQGVPVGGSTGQVLRKASNDNYDTEWAAAGSGSGSVTSVAVSGSDGIEVDSGSPITSSGTIALGINAATLRSHINVADGAEVNVNADWNASSGDAAILNKPTLGGAAALNVGTTTGTVAAGDDARFTDSRTPTAHAASHAAGQADELFDQSLNQADTPTFAGVITPSVLYPDGNGTGFNIVNGEFYDNATVAATWIGTEFNLEKPLNFTGPSATTDKSTTRTNLGLEIGTDVAAASHTHGNLTNDGKVGSTAGLPLKTGTAGVVEAGAFGTGAGEFAEGNHTHTQLHDRSHAITSTSDHTAGNHKVFYSNGSGEIVELALGNSGEVLTSNGATSAPSFAAASGGVSAVGASAADILSVSGSDLVADDPNADRLIFFDDSAGKLTHLTVGSGLTITDTTLSATSSFDPASPGAIGGTTPSTGAFTSLSTAPPANTSALTSTGYSLTGSNAQSLVDLAGTWNTTGTPSAIKLNITDTASNASSLLMQLQTGGANRFTVNKLGNVIASGAIGVSNGDMINNGFPVLRSSGTEMLAFTVNSNVNIAANGLYSIGWASGGPTGTGVDVRMWRDAAATWALRNGTNAQEMRCYGTFTSSTNYQRMTIKSVKQTLSALSGASATTTGTFIPDGAVVVGVTTRVATALTGASGYEIGDGTDADRWGDITGTAIGTTSDNRDWTAGTIECFTAGGEITLTAKTSNFTAGAIEICVFYLAGEAD